MHNTHIHEIPHKQLVLFLMFPEFLSREDRVYLARLRCGHHSTLQAHRDRLEETIPDTRIYINIIDDCVSPLILQLHNILSGRTMMESPVQVAVFLRSSGIMRA